jgi:hypothetical protein
VTNALWRKKPRKRGCCAKLADWRALLFSGDSGIVRAGLKIDPVAGAQAARGCSPTADQAVWAEIPAR